MVAVSCLLLEWSCREQQVQFNTHTHSERERGGEGVRPTVDHVLLASVSMTVSRTPSHLTGFTEWTLYISVRTKLDDYPPGLLNTIVIKHPYTNIHILHLSCILVMLTC